MLIWNVLSKLRFKQLISLFFLVFKHPILIYPTLKATSISYQLSKKKFPKSHHKSGKGNAFRHALWNLLICYECLKTKNNKVKIIAWAKTITDKHEEFSPNDALNKEMDLHNNRIGRTLFEEHDFNTIDEIILTLKEKLKTAKTITSVNDSKRYVDELVYINKI